MRNIFTPLLLLFVSTAGAQVGDGMVDGSFANGGSSITPIPGVGSLRATDRQDLYILPDGRILQSFTYFNGTDNDFGLARYLSDGTLDPSFGGGTGYVTLDLGGDDIARSFGLQSNGSIVLGGTSLGASGGQFALARFSSNGVLDPSFGTGGISLLDGSDNYYGYAVAIRPNDKILLGGQVDNGFAPRFGVAQFTANGALDNFAFGSGGIAQFPAINSEDQVNSLFILPDGSVLAGGYSRQGSTYDFALVKFTPTGNLDPSFGTGGYRLTDFGSTRTDIAIPIALTPTGKIVLAGFTDVGPGTTFNSDLALAQYTSTGNLDPSFGSGGTVTTPLGADESGYDLAVQPDGRIVLAGFRGTDVTSTDNDFVVARYLANGNLDPSFGGSGNGTNIIDLGANDLGFSMALGGSYILLGGVTGTGQPDALALVRLFNASTVLPVRFISFTGTQGDGTTLLSWQVADEQNVAAYDVERSVDGHTFSRIGTVASAGGGARSYSFTDLQPFNGLNFYRLKIKDASGQGSNSIIVVVRFAGKNGIQLQAFPNPVHTQLNLQITQPAGKVRLQVADAGGRIVRTMDLVSNGNTLSVPVDMQGLGSGVYFVRVNAETVKVVKE